MKITELLAAELDREPVGIPKALEQVPEGKNDWKPRQQVAVAQHAPSSPCSTPVENQSASSAQAETASAGLVLLASKASLSS